MGESLYAFESFSSRTWEWTIGAGVAADETVVPLSGVGAQGCAFWRTTMGWFLCYEPVSGCSDLVPAPLVVQQWPVWELGEMEGTLRATWVFFIRVLRGAAESWVFFFFFYLFDKKINKNFFI